MVHQSKFHYGTDDRNIEFDAFKHVQLEQKKEEEMSKQVSKNIVKPKYNWKQKYF